MNPESTPETKARSRLSLTESNVDAATVLPHWNRPPETPQLPLLVESVNPDPEEVAVNVAGVCKDQVPEVSMPPWEPPLVMSAVRVDLLGTGPGA